MLLIDPTKVKRDKMKIDMYMSASCDFHVTHFIMSLSIGISNQ